MTQTIFVLGITYTLCDCGSLPVVENSSNNATVQGTYPIGYGVRYTCNVGHEPDGIVMIVCGGGGWQTSPLRCREVYCPALNPPDNGRIVGSPSYKVGSYITYECNEGYIIHGTSHVTCQGDGTWSTRPVCKGISCPPFKGMDSNCVDRSLYYSTLYYMTCSNVPHTRVAGPTEDEPNVCQNDGSWQFQEFACYCSCNLTGYDSNIMTISNLTHGYLPHGNVLQWSCSHNCNKTTDDLRCLDGWMTMPQCDCPLP
ncbi:complement factor H-like [Mya arenaria]|uniref:complement factor H-like n=1 Tax=Mya arenaria TaxID=6604 RepID=UPI0022E7DFF1|nr:complement factor H-like [Mya arenaria]